MKKQLRWLVTATLLASVGTVLFLVGRQLWEQRKLDLAQKALQVIPGVSQHLRDFRRVHVEGGRKMWEVSAEDASYFDRDGIVVVRQPMVAWYTDDGRRMGLHADEGKVLLDGTDLQFIEVRGGIEVDLVELRILADEAVYDHVGRRISSSRRVQIAGRSLDAGGDEMLVELDQKKLTLLGNVSMSLNLAALQQGGAYELP